MVEVKNSCSGHVPEGTVVWDDIGQTFWLLYDKFEDDTESVDIWRRVQGDKSGGPKSDATVGI